jgi:PAS domain-containing protein
VCVIIEQQQWEWFSQQLAEFDGRLDSLHASADSLGDGGVPAAALAELETCREELRVAEEELRTQHEELVSVLQRQGMPVVNAHLLDDLPVATLVSDRLGVLRGVNRPAAQLLGERPHLLVGKPLAAYVDGDRKPFRQLLGRLAGGDHRSRLRVNLCARSGTLTPAVVIARREGDGVSWVVVPDEVLDGAETSAQADVLESAHLAIAGLALLPITTTALPDLLAEVEKLATAAVQGTARITLVLGGQDAEVPEAPEVPEEADETGRPVTFPLSAQGSHIGSMRVVPDAPEGLGPVATRTAELFTAAAAAVVCNARALQQSRELVHNLSQALENRSVIEQAKGMLMAVRHCDEDAAFDQLRVVSQRTNTKLHEVARRLVFTMSREDVGDPI